MNKNPTAWHQNSHIKQIKIASLNCAGLLPHLKDLLVDPKLKIADIIALQETSLTQDHDIPHFDGYTLQVAGRGRGKGVATLQKDGGNWEEIGKFESRIQILKCTSQKLDIINVYRSDDKSLIESAHLLNEFINPEKSTLIIGDFNVCARRNRNNEITKSLENLGFQQMIKDSTHIQGNVIDHVYWKDVDGKWEYPIIEHYCPYFTDHDALLITLRLVI